MRFASIEISVAMVLSMAIISSVVVVWIRKQDHLQSEAQKLMPPPGQQPTEEDVRRLAHAGHKIAAIKLYREIHGTGLADSKSAVEDLAAGNTPVRRAPEGNHLSDQAASNEEVLRLVRAGDKIAAIKLYREIYGSGLAEAKAAVEDLEARHGRGSDDH